MCHGVAIPLAALALITVPILLRDMRYDPSIDIRPSSTTLDDRKQNSYRHTSNRTLDDVIHFVQVSDLHISKFSPERYERLQQWCKEVLPEIAPSFVIASGDLTDGNRWINFENPFEDRGQVLEEWQQYKSMIDRYANRLPWHDIRGNHDAFNVGEWATSDVNYYNTHSSRGSVDQRHYSVEHQDGSGKIYRIVFVDAVVEPAPTRHFFGELTTKDLDVIEDLFARQPNPHKIFVVSHYPFNSIISRRSTSGRDLYDLLDTYNVVALFSGHLHQFMGALPQMYARHNHGTLELELGDFKTGSIFRIGAIDRNVFTFRDITMAEISNRPIILPTTPQDARFASPYSSSFLSSHTMTSSQRNEAISSIRFFVFSTRPLQSIDARINRKLIGTLDLKLSMDKSDDGRLGEIKEYDTPYWGDLGVFPSQNSKDNQKLTTHTRNKAYPGVNAGHSHSRLFELKFHPDKIKTILSLSRDEFGSLTIRATDEDGNLAVSETPFSWNGRALPMPSRISQWFMTHSFSVLLGHVSSLLMISITYITLFGTLIYSYLLRHGILFPAKVHNKPDDSSTTMDERNNSSSVHVHEYIPARETGWQWLLRRTYGPYVVLLHSQPKLFYFALFYSFYVLIGPWFIAKLYNQTWSALFAWGLVTIDGDILPHYDSTIYITQLFGFGLAPFIQMASMWSVAQIRRGNACLSAIQYVWGSRQETNISRPSMLLRANQNGDIEMSVSSTPKVSTNNSSSCKLSVFRGILVPSNEVSRPFSTTGIFLVTLQTIVTYMQVPFTVIFHGLIAVILAPVLWMLLFQSGWAILLLIRDIRNRGGGGYAANAHITPSGHISDSVSASTTVE